MRYYHAVAPWLSKQGLKVSCANFGSYLSLKVPGRDSRRVDADAICLTNDDKKPGRVFLRGLMEGGRALPRVQLLSGKHMSAPGSICQQHGRSRELPLWGKAQRGRDTSSGP